MSRPGSGTGSGFASGVRELLVRHGFLIIIAGFFGLFSFVGSNFLTPGNLMNIVEGSAILLILALGMTLVVAMGGIDLSVGIALDFGAAFAIVAMKEYQVAWYLAVLIGIGGGCLIGLLNALLVVKLDVSPFMATLGTFFIGSSVQRVFTNGGGPISYRQVDEHYRALAIGDVYGIPMEVIVAAVVFGIYWLLMERSVHGKRMHAIGLQQSAARVAGIPVGRYLVFGFVFASGTCAVAGLIGSANLRMFTPLAGYSYLLDAIAAVFIGASIHPRGRPSVPGTLVGVLFLGMVANGLNLMGLNFNIKDALSGLILVGALALAVTQRRLR